MSTEAPKRDPSLLLRTYGLSYGLSNFNVIFGQPLDRLKVGVQLSKNPPWQTTKDILRSGLKNLFTGLPVSLARQNTKPLYRTLLITVVPQHIDKLTENLPHGALLATAAKPTLSCLIDNTITTPFEVIKVAQMENPQIGLFRTMANIARAQGVRGFFNGWTPAVAKSMLPWLNLFFTHHVATEALKKHNKEMTIGNSIMVATASAVPITFATNPLDVVKTRMQARASKNNAGSKPGIIASMIQIATEEGVSTLWRGMLYRLCHRTQNVSIGLIVMSYYNNHFPKQE